MHFFQERERKKKKKLLEFHMLVHSLLSRQLLLTVEHLELLGAGMFELMLRFGVKV